jgi:tetratricopeptide (TPR) repeat protein
MLTNLLGSLFKYPLRARRSRVAKGLYETAIARKDAGDFDAALRGLQQVIALDPDHADANYWMGMILAKGRVFGPSAEFFERALKSNPHIPGGWTDLGVIHYFQGNMDKAGASFRAALAANPDSAIAHGNLGVVLRAEGHLQQALYHHRRAYELAPDGEGDLRNLVLVLVECDLCEEALAVAAEAVARNPASYEFQLALGFACEKVHDPARAMKHFAAAHAMRTDDAELYYNRGVALQDLGRLEEAGADFERALAMRAEFPSAAFHRGLARLLLRDFERGWEDYEKRRLGSDYPKRSSELRQWDGTPLAGRTLLVHSEQGLGDEIMFASIFPELIALPGRRIIECEPRLLGLFRRSFPGATVYAATPDRAVPAEIAEGGVDVEIAAGSLPRYFRRSLSDFPLHAGYLRADPARVEYWRERLSGIGPGLKVGISWTGGVRKTRRPLRSVALESCLPILKVGGVRWVSLQYTPNAAAEADEFGKLHGLRIEHWADAISDYDETAALVSSLDLVVSVCTSVIHLSGALARPAWVMAPYSPEWRYGFSGEDIPWYPTVRVFRQPAFGEWDPVIASVARELDRRAAEEHSR